MSRANTSSQPFQIMTQEEWVNHIFDAELTVLSGADDEVLVVKGNTEAGVGFYGIQVQAANTIIVIPLRRRPTPI